MSASNRCRLAIAISALVTVALLGQPGARRNTAWMGSARAADEATFAAMSSGRLLALARQYPASKRSPASPLSLTTDDGSGLVIAALTARIVVQQPLAFTELHLVFMNPAERVREGRFAIALPSSATVTRFAMKLPAGWQEAEVVKRREAQQVYEDFLHWRQDPALLQKKAGNEFSARVFPIPPLANKELKVSYLQSVTRAQPYRLLLRGLPRIGKLSISALVTEPGQRARRVSLSRSGRIPTSDFEISLPPRSPDGLQSAAAVVLPLSPRLDAPPAPLRSLLVLMDTSASRALGFREQVEYVAAVLRDLQRRHGEELRVRLVCFDQTRDAVFDGPISELSAAHLRAILARRPLGASDLAGALGAALPRGDDKEGSRRWSLRRGDRWRSRNQRAAGAAPRASRADRHRDRGGGSFDRLLLVTDGVITAGAQPGEGARRAAVTRLARRVRRLDVLLVGGIRDEPAMRRLTRGALTEDGVVLDVQQAPSETARRLSQRTISGLQVEVVGARWSWPRKLDGLQRGDEVLIFAELSPEARAARSTTVVLKGPLRQRHEVRLRKASGPLLARALARARIEKLQERLHGAGTTEERRAIERQIVALSLQQRALSDLTAMLVLETEADYARYGIRRDALADILAVGEEGVQLLRRRRPVTLARRQRPPAAPQGSSARRLAAPTGEGSLRPAPPTSVARPAPARGSEMDNDADSILDQDDLSPREPESYNGYQDEDGRPDRGRVVVHQGRIEIIDKIYFETGRAQIKPVSYPILDAIAATLRGNPQIQLVELQGHTDERGAAARKQLLSVARASAVRAHLVAKGVAPLRLVARGYGDRRPVDRRHDERAWSKNRRVEFLIRRRDGADRSTRAAAKPVQPLSGRLAKVVERIHRGQVERAVRDALAWHTEQPGSVLALIALGRAALARGNRALAARVYGSIIDLYPARADMRRFAGAQLEALGERSTALVIDTYQRAVEQRPDHPSGYHLLGLALARAGHYDRAIAALEAGVKQRYSIARRAVKRVLREDLGLVAAALVARAPLRRAEVGARLRRIGAAMAKRPSLRFVLTWETDTNDVDLHVRDRRGGHAYYGQLRLPSGGALLADVTNGYGPECFRIDGPVRGGPYRLSAHYYSRGPMGYGIGKVQVIEHDGRGGLRFNERPFVVMHDGAYADLGTFKAQRSPSSR